MVVEKTELQNKIDNDAELKQKRRLLVIISLLLLVIQFTGAEILKANTFIFEIKFNHQNGLTLLFYISLIFLLIRYYNYARKYHLELSYLWRSDLLSDPLIETYDENNHEISGLLHDEYPNGFNIDVALNEPDSHWRQSYICGPFFTRKFRHHLADDYDIHDYDLNIFEKLGYKKYFQILGVEAKHQALSFLKHRENFDILAPYFLGIAALASYTCYYWIEPIIKAIAH